VIENPILTVENLSLWYGKARALHGITMRIPEKKITAFIGPSGCGKSTLLRCFNRMNDLVDGVRTEGTIHFEGRSIHDPNLDVNALRSRIGMVFQKSNPFPKSIYENVAFGCRIQGTHRKRDLDPIVERACAPRRYGTRRRTACTKAPWACPAASSSGCASRAPSRSSPR
jgi:phosphate transport system ATP-binding protein